jgi:hypothetical protein
MLLMTPGNRGSSSSTATRRPVIHNYFSSQLASSGRGERLLDQPYFLIDRWERHPRVGA